MRNVCKTETVASCFCSISTWPESKQATNHSCCTYQTTVLRHKYV